MKLYERLPDSVMVGKKRVRLDLDFRNVLRMMEILQRNDLMPEAREWLAVKCVCRKPIPGTLEQVKKLLFKPGGGDGKRVTSFEQDADLIRSAFRQEYGINLWTDKLHWIEFMELFHCLPEGNRFSDTVGIRLRDMPEPNKWNAKERQALAKAKASVALKMTEDERENQYQQDVLSIFHALLPLAEKEVNEECQTDGSSLK